jgi:hypothetical protein
VTAPNSLKVLCLNLFVFLLISVPFTLASEEERHSFQPKGGFVPDKITAIRIAEAILGAIFGEEKIKNERPFTAILNNGVWLVEGTPPGGRLGGSATIELSQRDGRVLRVSHGK